ncbi:hypothetical protein BGP_2444 [Beggiatoa sp. PS]|nr:hypothetical protein BGP_2444 [Beggiatoa sp. PS]
MQRLPVKIGPQCSTKINFRFQTGILPFNYSCYAQCFNQKNPFNPNIFYRHDLSIPLPPSRWEGELRRAIFLFLAKMRAIK